MSSCGSADAAISAAETSITQSEFQKAANEDDESSDGAKRQCFSQKNAPNEKQLPSVKNEAQEGADSKCNLQAQNIPALHRRHTESPLAKCTTLLRNFEAVGRFSSWHKNALAKAVAAFRTALKSKENKEPIASPSAPSPASAQWMSLLSRVYVGSINFELREAEIATLFCQFGGIRSISIAYEGNAAAAHKGYCFVEFDCAEAALLAVENMEGVSCGGRGLKMGRPNAFPATFPAELPPGVAAPPPNRVYISNVHELITEEDIKLLCEPFGSVASTCLAADSNVRGRHRGYAYVDFDEARAATRAIKHINGLRLAGFVLHATAAVAGNALPMSVGAVLRRNGGVDPIAQNALLLALARRSARSHDPAAHMFDAAASPVILLRSIAYAHEVDEHFDAEVRAELRNSGRVVAFDVTVDDRPENANAVHIFARFDGVSAADRALVALNGRWFSGRRLTVEKYPLIRHEIRDFYC